MNHERLLRFQNPHDEEPQEPALTVEEDTPVPTPLDEEGRRALRGAIEEVKGRAEEPASLEIDQVMERAKERGRLEEAAAALEKKQREAA